MIIPKTTRIRIRTTTRTIKILVVLGIIISLLTRYLKDQKDVDESDQEVISQGVDLGKLFRSDAIVGAVVFIFAALVLKTLIDGAFTIGVQQGYQPTQPIAYSHALHAGEYEIDCNYCHTGARKAKSANIPSANICMNCHTVIQNIGDEPGISPEIAKIYAAIDYDPESGEYGNDTKPIEWVRIHNLPDLAYFNHAQHVTVGGLECQECHGPIEEMEVVYQYNVRKEKGGEFPLHLFKPANQFCAISMSGVPQGPPPPNAHRPVHQPADNERRLKS